MSKAYEQPEVREIGSLHELTQQQNKVFGPTDGNLFNGVPIANAS